MNPETESRKSDRAHRSRVPGGRVATHARSDVVGCCAAQCREVQRSAAKCSARTATLRRARRNDEPLFKDYFFSTLSLCWDGFYLENYLPQLLASSTWKRPDPLTSRSLPFLFISFLLFFSNWNIVSRSLSLEIGIYITPSCATSPRKLSIDRITVDVHAIDRRDTLPMGCLNSLRSWGVVMNWI